MFHMLIVLFSGNAFAQDGSEEMASETTAEAPVEQTQDIPETEAELASAVAPPALTPEQSARMSEIEARLEELGMCDIKRKKKKAQCTSEKSALELELAELAPAPEAPTATRAVLDVERADEGMRMGEEEAPGEEEGLELDVGDE